MLARKFRLNKKNLTRLYQKGKKFRQSSFYLRFMPNRAQNSRFAVVISKKIAAKSTDRSRLKRKIMMALEEYLKTKPANLDISLALQKIPSDEETLKKDVLATLNQIRVVQ